MKPTLLKGTSTLLYHELEEQRHRLAMINRLSQTLKFDCKQKEQEHRETIEQHNRQIYNMYRHQMLRAEKFCNNTDFEFIWIAINDPEIELQWPDRY